MSAPKGKSFSHRIKREIAEFLKIQNYYFPKLIEDIKKVLDGRDQRYITYEIEVILYIILLKNECSIASMQEMNDAFNEDECVKNIYRILGLEKKEYLLHYVTISLSKLDNAEMEKIRKEMIYSIIRKKSFDEGKFLGKYWLVIVDATQLFSFKEHHCEHCLTKTFQKGTDEEKTLYYHQVLEAKIVFGDALVFSIATEFVENAKENASKQDCELKSFKKLARTLKTMFPRLPICLMGVFQAWQKDIRKSLISAKEKKRL